MDIAIVTGAESVLGIRVVERLIRQGCRVYGLGNNFSQTTYTHKDFIPAAVDISNLKASRDAIEQIVNENGAVHLLIHAIDVAPATDFERLGVGNLEALMTIGLMTPVILTRLLLPNLLQVRGQLLFVLSTNKEGAPANATSGLMEAGLRRFASELLLRHRDSGLRVSTILLRHNCTPVDVRCGNTDSQTRIHPDHAATAIERILAEDDPNILGELTLYPRCSPAAVKPPATILPIDPYQQIQLPPKHKRAQEPEPISTRMPERPKAVFTISDAELEDRIAEAIEDFQRDSQSEPSLPVKEHDSERKNKRSRGRNRRQRERRDRDQSTAKISVADDSSTPAVSDSSGADAKTSESADPPALAANKTTKQPTTKSATKKSTPRTAKKITKKKKQAPEPQ
jgi:NAD(P)-dependent dehydrogenase (short-subunit alcohol dehydrogenase family)